MSLAWGLVGLTHEFRERTEMLRVILLALVAVVAGCSSSVPEPPELNAETEAAIEAEQAAVEQAESEQ